MVPAAIAARIGAPAPCRNQFNAFRGVTEATIASWTAVRATGTTPSGPVSSSVVRRASVHRSQRPRS